MATRFYLPSSGNNLSGVANIPANQMGWHNYGAQETAQFMYKTKKNSTLTTTTIKNADATSGYRTHLIKRFVSEPLAAQTISGTLSGILQCYESASGLNGTLAIAVYRVDNDGDYQDTLLSISYSDSAVDPYEMYAAIRSRYFYNSSESNSLSLTSRTFSSGDRLVVEIGFAESNTLTSRGAYFRFGDPTSSSDYTTYNDTDQTKAGWIEFSANIVLEGEKKVTQSSSGSDSIGIVNKTTIIESSVLKNLLETNIANGCEDGTWGNEWTEFDTDGNLTVSVDETNEYSGSRCLKLAVSGDTSSYNYVETTDQAVTPSTNYTVSCQAKTGGSGGGLLGLLWSDADHTFIDNNHTTFTNTTYQKVSFTQLMPANAAFVHVYFTVDIGTGARTFYGDEFQLEQGSSATAWQDPSAVGADENISLSQKTTISVVDWKANPKNKLPINVANGAESGTVTGLNAGANVTLTSQDILKYAGNYAISYYNNGSDKDVYLNDSDLVPTTPSTEWVFSLYLNNPDYLFKYGLAWYNSSKTLLSVTDTSVIPAGFRMVYINGEAPANTAYVGIYLEGNNTYQSGYFDNLQLEQGTYPTGWEIPFTPGLNSSEVVTKASGDTAKNISDTGSDSETLSQKNTFTIPQTGSGSESPIIKNTFTTSEVVQRGKNKFDLNVANGCEDGTTKGLEPYDAAIISSTTEYKYAGNRSLKVDCSTIGGTQITTYIPVTEGNDYVVSAYIKYDDTNPMGLGISWFSVDRIYINTTYIYDINGNTSFEREYVTGEAPTDAVYAKVWVELGTEESGAIAYVDNLQFEAGTYPTTYEDPKGIFETPLKSEFDYLELYDDLTDFITEGITAKGKLATTDSGTDTETLSQKNKFTVPQTGTGVETLIRDINALITDSESLTDIISIKNFFKISDTKTATDTIAISNEILQQDNFSVAEVLIRDKLIPLIETATGSESPLIKKISVMLETGSSSDLFSIINQLSRTDSGSGADVPKLTTKRTIQQTASGAEVLANKIMTLIQQAGHGTDTNILKTFEKVTDTATDSEVVKQTKKFTGTDAGSGAEIPSMKVSQQVVQGGSGVDTPNLQIKPIVQQAGSGADTPGVKNKFTSLDKIGAKNKFSLHQATGGDRSRSASGWSSIQGQTLIYDSTESYYGDGSIKHTNNSGSTIATFEMFTSVPFSYFKTNTQYTYTIIAKTDQTNANLRLHIERDWYFSVVDSSWFTANNWTVFSFTFSTIVTPPRNANLVFFLQGQNIQNGKSVWWDSAQVEEGASFTSWEFPGATDIPTLTNHLATADTGSGAETPSLKTGVANSDTGNTTDLQAIKNKFTVQQTGSGVETPILTNHLSTSDSSISVDDASKLIHMALSDAGTDAESIDIADLIYRVSVGDSDAFDDMVAILSHIGVSDAKTSLTEVLTQKNTMKVFEAMEDYKKNKFPANVSTGTDTKGDTTGFGTKYGTETISSSTEQYYQGSRSLKCITPGNQSNEGVAFANIPLGAIGKTVTFSLKVYAPNGATLRAVIEEGDMSSRTVTNITGNGAWQTVTVTRTLTTSSAYLWVQTNTTQQAVTFYLDQLQFEEGSTATTWRMGNILTYNQQSVETDLNGLTGANGTLTRDTTNYFSGNASAKLAVTAISDANIYAFYTSIPNIIPGKSYAFIVRGKYSVAGGRTGYLKADIKKANGDPLSGVTTSAYTLSDNWQTNVLTFTAPPLGERVSLSSRIMNAAIGEIMWWDDAWLVELPDREALALANRFAATETGSGADVPSLKNKFTLLESEEFTDVPTLTSHLASADTGSGAEVPSLSTKVPITQSGSGSEVPSLLSKVPITQSASGSDVSTIKNAITKYDKVGKNLLYPKASTYEFGATLADFSRSNCTMDFDDTTFYQGYRSMKYVATGGRVTFRTGSADRTQIPVEAGQKYSASLYLKTQLATPLDFEILIYWYDKTNTFITTTGGSEGWQQIPINSDWYRFESKNHTAPVGAYYAMLMMYQKDGQDATIGDIFWADAWQLERGTIVTNYEVPGSLDVISILSQLSIPDENCCLCTYDELGIKQVVDINEAVTPAELLTIRAALKILESPVGLESIQTGYITRLTASDAGVIAEATAIANRFVIEEYKKNLAHPNVATGGDLYNNLTGFGSYVGGSISRDINEKYNGSGSVKCITPGIALYEGVFGSGESILNKEQYTYSAWIKAPVGAQMRIRVWSSSGGSAQNDFTATGDWERHYVTFTPGASSTYAYLYVFTTSIQAITFYVDEIQYEAGSMSDWSYPSIGGQKEPVFIKNQTLITDSKQLTDLITLENAFAVADSLHGAETPVLKNKFSIYDVENKNILGPVLATGGDTTKSTTGVTANKCDLSYSTEQAKNGDGCLKTVSNNASNADSFFYLDSTSRVANSIKPGNTYTISGWIYIPSATGLNPEDARGLKICFYIFTPTGNSRVDTIIPSQTDTWTYISVTRTLPLNATSTSIRAYNGWQTAGKVVYYDQLQIEQNNTATEWQYPGLIDIPSLKTSQKVSEYKKNIMNMNQATGSDSTGTTSGFGVANATISSVTEEAWQGIRSVKTVTDNAGAGEGLLIGSQIAINSSKQYTVSLYAKGSGTIVLNAYNRNIVGTTIGAAYQSAPITLTSDWQRITVTWTTDVAAYYTYFRLITNSKQTATFYVDGIQLEEGGTATTWEVPSIGQSLEKPLLINRLKPTDQASVIELATLIKRLRLIDAMSTTEYPYLRETRAIFDTISLVDALSRLKVAIPLTDNGTMTDSAVMLGTVYVDDEGIIDEAIKILSDTINEHPIGLDDVHLKQSILKTDSGVISEALRLVFYLDLGDVEIDLLFEMDIAIDEAITEDMIVETEYEAEAIIRPSESDDIIVEEEKNEDIRL